MKSTKEKAKGNKKVRLSLYLTKDLRDKLDVLATKNERSISFVAQKIMEGNEKELKQAA